MNSKSVEFTKKEIIAGLFVILSIATLVVFVLLIRGYRPHTGTKIYYAKFKNTLGLDRGADVRYGGLKVGKVVDIYPDESDPTQVCVKMAISPHVTLNQKCVASVEQVSLTSARHLEISTGDAEAPIMEEGSTITAINKSGALIELPDFSTTMTKVERLLDDLTDFLGMDRVRTAEATTGTSKARVTELTQQVSDTLQKGSELVDELNAILKEQKPNITQIVNNLNDIENEVKKALEQVNAIIAENRAPIQDTMQTLKGILEKVQAVLENSSSKLEVAMANIERITSNVDNLSEDARLWIGRNKRNLDEIIVDLRETIRNLRLLSQTLAEQPQSILTGKIPTGRK